MTEPKVLLYDTETAPNLGWVWGKWEQDVLSFESQWYIMCFAYKFLGDKGKPEVVALPDFAEQYANDPTDDSSVVDALHTLFSEADIVVAHNGNQFDQPKARTRMIVHNMNPPDPYKELDTLQIARRNFHFTSNKLDDLCAELGIGRKQSTGGFGLWLGCMQGDPAAWEKMKRYNQHDVILLEKLYLRLRPWVPRHPNMSLIADRPESCPRCNACGTMQARGFAVNTVSKRRRYQCQECGGWAVGRKLEKSEVIYTNN